MISTSVSSVVGPFGQTAVLPLHAGCRGGESIIAHCRPSLLTSVRIPRSSQRDEDHGKDARSMMNGKVL